MNRWQAHPPQAGEPAAHHTLDRRCDSPEVSNVSILIIEPEQTEKLELAALRFSRGGQRAAHIPPAVPVSELKQRIRQIRETARDDIDSLLPKLEAALRKRFPEARLHDSADASDAVDYVTRTAGAVRAISTNNSVAVHELRPGLLANGFEVINSYHNEFRVSERKLLDYWDLPRLLDKDIESSFGVALAMEALPRSEAKQYVALLGVNAVSAEDGTVVFLEHFSNIKKDLDRAGKVVLVVGLDKVVPTRAEAMFQAQCMGVFGTENIVLGIEPLPATTKSIDELELPSADGHRELHIVILDNGRRRMIDGKFRDLFLCIGCRACNKHCPIRHAFHAHDYIWTPKTYLTRFLSATEESVDVCLHCEACRLECPVDIDLPGLMWQAKLDLAARRGTSVSHKILGRPELLAKLGTTVAPLSNWAMRQNLVRIPMERVTGIDRRTTLPVFHVRTFKKRARKHE